MEGAEEEIRVLHEKLADAVKKERVMESNVMAAVCDQNLLEHALSDFTSSIRALDKTMTTAVSASHESSQHMQVALAREHAHAQSLSDTEKRGATLLAELEKQVTALDDSLCLAAVEVELAHAEARSAEGVEELVAAKWRHEAARQDEEKKEELVQRLYEHSLDTSVMSESLAQQQLEVAVLTEYTKELQYQVTEHKAGRDKERELARMKMEQVSSTLQMLVESLGILVMGIGEEEGQLERERERLEKERGASEDKAETQRLEREAEREKQLKAALEEERQLREREMESLKNLAQNAETERERERVARAEARDKERMAREKEREEDQAQQEALQICANMLGAELQEIKEENAYLRSEMMHLELALQVCSPAWASAAPQLHQSIVVHVVVLSC